MTTRPDIVFIVVDDCGYADLSCTGQNLYATPNLDRLAREGTRFTQAYANSALCTNTRVAIMTGRYQYRFKIGIVEPLRRVHRDDPEMGLPPEHPTLPSLLRDSGYRTALIGKWHVGFAPHFGPLKSGYESFFGIMSGYTGYYTHTGEGGDHDLWEGEVESHQQGYVTDILSERAAAHVEAMAQQDAPYFLSLHYTAPHAPWSAPSVEAAARAREMDPKQVTDGGNLTIYAEMMTCLDAGIGRVMEAIRRTGRPTLVLFTSDNGGERFSKIWPFVGRKRDLLEGGLRVPQIAWWPGRVAAGRVSEQVTISMDLTATCLDAGGAALSAEYPLDGISLLPHIAGDAPATDRLLFWRMFDRNQASVRHGKWKYLRVSGKEYLFDLDYDARERTDFARKHPALVAELRARWAEWDAGMLPLPKDLPQPIVQLSEMLW
jgi:arylsulfatase A-like enzyme